MLPDRARAGCAIPRFPSCPRSAWARSLYGIALCCPTVLAAEKSFLGFLRRRSCRKNPYQAFLPLPEGLRNGERGSTLMRLITPGCQIYRVVKTCHNW